MISADAPWNLKPETSEPLLFPLFFKHEKNRQHQAGEAGQVVPFESFGLEQGKGKNGEYRQGDDFLNDLQFHEWERSAIQSVADAVGRHHEAVFEEGDAPTDDDNGKQSEVLRHLHFLELQVAIPSKGHEGVGQY